MQTPTQAAKRTPRLTSHSNPWPHPELPDYKEVGLRAYWLCEYMRCQARRYEILRIYGAGILRNNFAACTALLHADDGLRDEVKESLTLLIDFGGLLMAFPETTAIAQGGAA